MCTTSNSFSNVHRRMLRTQQTNMRKIYEQTITQTRTYTNKFAFSEYSYTNNFNVSAPFPMTALHQLNTKVLKFSRGLGSCRCRSDRFGYIDVVCAAA